MSSSTRVHFRAPERLIEQADALAVAEEKTRTDVLVDALREYPAESTAWLERKPYENMKICSVDIFRVMQLDEHRNANVKKSNSDDYDLQSYRSSASSSGTSRSVSPM
jgi:hypothetical protein